MGSTHTVTIISKSAGKKGKLMHASERHKHDGLTIPINRNCIQEGDCWAYAVTSKQCEQCDKLSLEEPYSDDTYGVTIAC